MLYWLIIGIVFLYFAIFFARKQHRKDKKEPLNFTIWPIILAVVGFFIAGTIIICCLCAFLGFNRFEYEIELRREQYSVLTSENYNIPSSNVYIIEDVMTINEELTALQASRAYYNNWSLYPERVLDIQPIGLEQE